MKKLQIANNIHRQTFICVVFQVAKNRYSGDVGIMTLEFDKQSLSFQNKKPKAKKISDQEQVKSKE